MSKHTTEEAVDIAAKAIASGVALVVLKRALMSDGFPSKKAEVIVLWALRKVGKANEKNSRIV